MKALLIDPFQKTITEIEHDNSLEDIYRHTRCDTFTTVMIDRHGGTLFVDDEGLLKPFDSQAFFKIDTYADPLAGYAMVVGTDDEGETVDVAYTIDQIKARVQFLSHAQVARML